ncbi:DUF6049 family protein [Leucobacter sp. USCH14]|uniref:DUF6049 family protein n=1 Tax=Leucobacter sp. USCH14 TaxID=3024838 RepID=UPI0030A7B3C9
MLPLLRLHARAVGSWALAGAVLAGAVFGTSVEPPRSADGAPITSETGGGADVELVVSPREPVIAAADDEVQFGLLIRNSTSAALPAGTVSLELDATRLNDPAELEEALPESAIRFAEAEVGSTAPGADQTVTVTVPRGELPIGPNAAAGAYRVGATLEFVEAPEPGFALFGAEPTDQTAVVPATVSSGTSIVWKGAGAQSVPLSVIVPFVLPPDIRTLPTRGQLEDLAPGWDRLLTAARTHEATLAIDPRVIAGIRAYGDEAPRNAQLLLNRLETTPLPSFLLQFADADPSAQAALGFTTLLEPTSLDFVSRFGSFSEAPASDAGTEADADSGPSSGSGSGSDSNSVADGASGTESTDSADEADAGAESTPEIEPESAPLPALSDLLAWPQQESLHAWPAEGRADPALLPLLESEGVDSLVLSSEGVELAGGPRGSIGDTEVTVTDAELDRAARTALRAATETERSGGVARIAAELVLEAQDGSDGVVLALDRGATGGAADPAALLEQLETFAWTSPTAIAEQGTGSVELRPSGPLQDRLELLRSASNREGSVNEVGAVLTHPEYLSGYQRTRLLELFSTRYAGDEGGFADVAAAFRERDAELLSGVQAISTEHIQLVGSSSRVPVQLRNALPFDAAVTVDVEPASAALSVEERRFEDVIVPAETTERVLVPVRSRVSSGESGLVVSVSAADEQTTVFTGTLSITIRSSIETIIFWSLGGLAVLLLVFGILRSVRRRRHRAEGSSGAQDAPEEPARAM